MFEKIEEQCQQCPRFTDCFVKDTYCPLGKNCQLCLPVWVQHLTKVAFKNP